MFLAKVAIRVMELLQQRAANIKFAGDILTRVQSVHRILGMLADLPPHVLKDIDPIIDGVRKVRLATS